MFLLMDSVAGVTLESGSHLLQVSGGCVSNSTLLAVPGIEAPSFVPTQENN